MTDFAEIIINASEFDTFKEAVREHSLKIRLEDEEESKVKDDLRELLEKFNQQHYSVRKIKKHYSKYIAEVEFFKSSVKENKVDLSEKKEELIQE